MQNQTLDDKLHLLDFETDSSAAGLLFTNKDYKNVSFDEILILHRAEELKANAVFFRRIERSSIPQIFIYDNSDNRLLDSDLIDIHRKLWSSGIVPLYYVFDNTEVKIFNCRESLQEPGDKPPSAFDSLSLTAKVHDQYKYEKYSERQFRNGSFWELAENKNRFKADSSSYNKLIEGLRNLRNAFIKGQDATACNKLLVLSIFVKYLEERKDRKGKHVLPSDYFSEFDGATSFCAVLRKSNCIKLFEKLAKAVNGKIFKLADEEKMAIAEIDQSKLADFLDAKLELGKRQHVFWRLYDFNYLPVELISRIYEEFIPSRKDITYTPIHLVDFMINECMPTSTPQNGIKIIDVSCGSGVFLVAAFKRLVRWWQKEQYKKTGKIKHPNIKILKSIITEQIYGVDIEIEAKRLAIFSLTVAVCEMLDPAIMWEELTREKFVDLSNNIIKKDFFDFIKTQEKFDIVIGNPPFNLPFKDEERKGKDEYWESLIKKTSDFEVPNKSIALLFLQQAMKLLKKDGLLSFVMPSSPLLYADTLQYRKNFLSRYNVPQIFDFTCLRQKGALFENRGVSVAVIFAQNMPPTDKAILHAIVKRTVTSKEKLFFEIDKYDLHYVSKELAKTDQSVWKTNLLGGGHLYHLIKRIQTIRTLENYLKEKKKDKKGRGKDKWEYGTGYFVSESKKQSSLDESTTASPQQKNKRKPAAHLTGKQMIPTAKFNNDTINEDDIVIEKETLFEGRREGKRLIFKKPHILIKTNIKLPVFLYNKDIIFRRDITGIHAPDCERGIDELSLLESNIKKYRPLYKALLMLSSGKLGIGRETAMRSKDILGLPYPEDSKKLKLSKAEEIMIEDVLEYGFEQLSKGEEAKANIKLADKHALDKYAHIFCTSLNSIYRENAKQFYPLDYIESSSYICYPFGYGSPDKPKKISGSQISQIKEGNLKGLIDNPQGENVLYKRIIKLYGKDIVYLIKPKTLRYWLKSIALRDANEVFTDLVSSGY